jgi:hypothetical protein
MYKVEIENSPEKTLITEDYAKAQNHYMMAMKVLEHKNDFTTNVMLFRKDGNTRYIMRDQRYQFEEQKGQCRVCGCSWYKACAGGCYWVEPGLCSCCDDKQKKKSLITSR